MCKKLIKKFPTIWEKYQKTAVGGGFFDSHCRTTYQKYSVILDYQSNTCNKHLKTYLLSISWGRNSLILVRQLHMNLNTYLHFPVSRVSRQWRKLQKGIIKSRQIDFSQSIWFQSCPAVQKSSNWKTSALSINMYLLTNWFTYHHHCQFLNALVF